MGVGLVFGETPCVHACLWYSTIRSLSQVSLLHYSVRVRTLRENDLPDLPDMVSSCLPIVGQWRHPFMSLIGFSELYHTAPITVILRTQVQGQAGTVNLAWWLQSVSLATISGLF